MKKLVVPALIVLGMQPAFAAEYTVNKITNNHPPYVEPNVMANGDVAWYGPDGNDFEVYLYKAQTGAVSQLTNNTVGDYVGASNSRGDFLIYTQTGGTLQLSRYDASTGNVTILGASGWQSDINDNGDVVWVAHDGNDYEIFLYTSSTATTSQLTDNTTDDLFTLWMAQYLGQQVIDNNGNVVWYGNDGDNEIFLYSAATGTITQLTDNSLDDRNPTIGEGNVAWNSFEDVYARLYLYKAMDQSTALLASNTSEYTMNANGNLLYWDDAFNIQRYNGSNGSTTAITADGQGGWKIHQNGQGDAVWVAYGNVYKYDASTGGTSQLSSVNAGFSTPRLSDNGDVTWVSNDGTASGVQEVFAYDAQTQTTVQISTDLVEDGFPQITSQGDIVWPGYENGVWEIYLASKQTVAAHCELTTLPLKNPVAINNRGDVLYYDRLWKDSEFTSITIPGAAVYFGAKDLNDNGQVIVNTADRNGAKHGYLWENGVVTDLGLVQVESVNNAGQVAGSFQSLYSWYGFLWQNGVKTNLGLGSAYQVNNLGQVAGRFNNIFGIWDNGNVLPFGSVPSVFFMATPRLLNDNGQSVTYGLKVVPSFTQVVVVSQNGVASEIGVLPSFVSYNATGINNDGIIVGRASGYTSNTRGFVVVDGQISDLSDKLPADSGWDYVTDAHDINNAGQIIGTGRRTDGTFKSFVMSGACLQ